MSIKWVMFPNLNKQKNWHIIHILLVSDFEDSLQYSFGTWKTRPKYNISMDSCMSFDIVIL